MSKENTGNLPDNVPVSRITDIEYEKTALEVVNQTGRDGSLNDEHITDLIERALQISEDHNVDNPGPSDPFGSL